MTNRSYIAKNRGTKSWHSVFLSLITATLHFVLKNHPYSFRMGDGGGGGGINLIQS